MGALSEGRRLLVDRLKPAGMSCRTIAEVAGVSRQAVHAWANGESKPAYRARKALFAHYEIPVDAWDEPPRRRPEDAAAALPLRVQAHGGASL